MFTKVDKLMVQNLETVILPMLISDPPRTNATSGNDTVFTLLSDVEIL